jgi:hypothetical protein
MFILKMRSAISCAVVFYNAGAVTHDRRIGGCIVRKIGGKWTYGTVPSDVMIRFYS